MTASSSTETLAALGAKIDPDRPPPTEADLIALRQRAIAPGTFGGPEFEALQKAYERLEALYPCQEGPGIMPPQFLEAAPVIHRPDPASYRLAQEGDSPPFGIITSGSQAGLMVKLDDPRPRPEPTGRLLAYTGSGNGNDGRTRTLEEMHADAIAAEKAHPLVPLIRCWFEHPPPRPVEAETRPDPVFPAVLSMAKSRGRRETLPLLGLLPESAGPSQIPMFGPEFDRFGGEFQASVLPVAMYRTAGKGAPLAVRLLLRAVLDTPQGERDGRPVFLPRTPWRDVVAELMPGGYRPAMQWPGLQRGLEALQADPRFLVPIPTGKGGYVGRRVVLATEQPLTGHRSEWVRFMVHLPPGADRGPIAWRTAWFLAAAHSTARFALATGLSVLWDRPGTLRVKPNPRAPFVQATDFRRYDALTRRELASLAFPNGWPKRYGRNGRKRAEREAVEHLHALAKTGYCRIRRERGGWRVMPAADWPGWTQNQRGKLAK